MNVLHTHKNKVNAHTVSTQCTQIKQMYKDFLEIVTVTFYLYKWSLVILYVGH